MLQEQLLLLLQRVKSLNLAARAFICNDMVYDFQPKFNCAGPAMTCRLVLLLVQAYKGKRVLGVRHCGGQSFV